MLKFLKTQITELCGPEISEFSCGNDIPSYRDSLISRINIYTVKTCWTRATNSSIWMKPAECHLISIHRLNTHKCNFNWKLWPCKVKWQAISCLEKRVMFQFLINTQPTINYPPVLPFLSLGNIQTDGNWLFGNGLCVCVWGCMFFCVPVAVILCVCVLKSCFIGQLLMFKVLLLSSRLSIWPGFYGKSTVPPKHSGKWLVRKVRLISSVGSNGYTNKKIRIELQLN